MKTTGFNSAANVVPGTTIERVYYVVPGQYTISADGIEHETMADALRAAIDRAVESERVVAYAAKPSVDVRWVMSSPAVTTWPGSRPASQPDLVAERFHYTSIDDARAHLARIEKYAEAV